jgi:hypothetical protein
MRAASSVPMASQKVEAVAGSGRFAGLALSETCIISSPQVRYTEYRCNRVNFLNVGSRVFSQHRAVRQPHQTSTLLIESDLIELSKSTMQAKEKMVAHAGIRRASLLLNLCGSMGPIALPDWGLTVPAPDS